jgi:hypothetical protein
LMVFNLDKYFDQKKFDKWLKSVGVTYKKSKKVVNTTFAVIRFEV